MLFNYYQLLGIKPTASNTEIKAAYRSLVKKYHPDKALGDPYSEEHIKKIIEAYTVLIDAEKRKNYDLKLAYAANAKSSKETTYTHTNRHKSTSYKTNRSYKPAPAPPLPFWVYVIAAAFIILMLVMLIKYPNGKDDEYDRLQALLEQRDSALLANTTAADKDVVNKKEEIKRIIDTSSDSTNFYPYFNYFGKGLYDQFMKTTIIVTNNTTYDAVLLLLENEAPHRVIRNHYLKQGTVCYMLHIPNGVYFIRAYFGEHWNIDKRILAGVKGGFDSEAGYFQFNRTTDLLVANQSQQGKNTSNTNYETSLKPLLNDTTNKITANHFWKMIRPNK